MTTMVLENLNGTLLELFKRLAIETGVTFSLTSNETDDSTSQVSTNMKYGDTLAFNRALLNMPILDGYDEIDIFAREPNTARDIDLSN